MEPLTYFEDIAPDEIHESSARTITETDIILHAGHTGDFFPHHVDAQFAAGTQFGQRIAHGTMIFAIGVGLKALAQMNAAGFSYGYDRLRL